MYRKGKWIQGWGWSSISSLDGCDDFISCFISVAIHLIKKSVNLGIAIMEAMTSVGIIESTCKCIHGITGALEQTSIEVEKVNGNGHTRLRW